VSIDCGLLHITYRRIEIRDEVKLRFEVSHPSGKNKDAARMGHPEFHLPWVGNAGGRHDKK